MRAAAAAALGGMNSRKSISKLRMALNDKDPSVVLAEAHAVELMHDKSAYEVYCEVLNGERKTGKGLIAYQTSMHARMMFDYVGGTWLQTSTKAVADVRVFGDPTLTPEIASFWNTDVAERTQSASRGCAR